MKKHMKLLRMGNLIFLTLIMIFVSISNLVYAGEWDNLLDNEIDINVEMLDKLNTVVDQSNYKNVSPDNLVGGVYIGRLIKSPLTIEHLKGSISGQYKDITGKEWYAKEIGLASALNIAQGYPDSTFKGNNKVTRIEFMTMLARATNGQAYYQVETLEQLNGDKKASLHSKNKEMTDAWFRDIYVGLGQSLFPDGTYTKAELNQPITRYEVAWWITNYGLVQTNKYIYSDSPLASVGYMKNEKDVNKVKFFTDVPALIDCKIKLEDLMNVTSTATAGEKDFGALYIDPSKVKDGKADINETMSIGPVILELRGIVQGYPDGTFKGYNELTRAEAITILNRLAVPIVRVPTSITDEDYFKYKVGNGVFSEGSTEKPYWAVKEMGELADGYFELSILISKNLDTQFATLKQYLLDRQITATEVQQLINICKKKTDADIWYSLNGDDNQIRVKRGGVLRVSSKQSNPYITITYNPTW